MKAGNVVQWLDKKYHSLNYHLREKFGDKVTKISLDAGFTCPNRDGTLGYEGCIFCSERGSGDFTSQKENLAQQFEEVRQQLESKWKNNKYIAHLQAFTNTYAPVEVLKKKYYEVLDITGVCGIAIATRPDCLQQEVLELLEEINSKTYLFVELGLQTSNDKTARLINRGYELSCFEKAVKELRKRNIEVVNHLIFGLPGETKEQMLNSVKYIANMDIQGIKLQMLYVLPNTQLAQMYEKKEFELMSQEEYVNLVADSLEILPPKIVIHRLTGDGPKDILIAPEWSKNKRAVLNAIDKELALRNSYQGKFSPSFN